MSFIAEYTIDSPMLRETHEAVPEMTFEMEDLQLLEGTQPKYVFWAWGGDFDQLERTLGCDPYVLNFTHLTTVGQRRLYRLTFTQEAKEMMTYPEASRFDIVFLGATSTVEGVHFRAQVPTREALSDFRRTCEAKGLSFSLDRIYQEGDDELPPNEFGEIAVKSYQSPPWMWGDDERAAAAFEGGWWRSGDRGRIDEEGFLYIEGRIDFQIKSKGVKITPESIEGALENHDAVVNAAVVGVDDPEYGQKVTAIVERSVESLSAGDLDEWMLESDAVADHERPRAYEFVDAIDRTPSGKLDRQGTKDRLNLD